MIRRIIYIILKYLDTLLNTIHSSL